MSAHETAADIEAARDIAQADHESRPHEVRTIPRNDGPFRKYRSSCAVCGPLGDWTTDRAEACRVGRLHESAHAADAVTGGAL